MPLPVQSQTMRRSGFTKKPFAWSYSKLKNFEACPKRHWHVDLAKDWKEPYSEELKHGDTIHKLLEQRVGYGTALPPLHSELEQWAKRVLDAPGTVLVEQQLAITSDFRPTAWFASEAARDAQPWFRAKIDVVKLHGPVALVIDWKTGKVKEDVTQLLLNAAAVMYHHPEVLVVRSYFFWLAEDAESEVTMHRDQLPELWSSLWPRIEALRLAHETTDYPAFPNRLCAQWCPVKSCPHNGQRHG